jgi:hypothetical protein
MFFHRPLNRNIVADLYIVLYDAIITDTTTTHGRSGLYFAENGTHELVQVGEIIARTLFEHGRGKSPKPTSFTTEEGVKYFGPLVCRCFHSSRTPISFEQNF